MVLNTFSQMINQSGVSLPGLPHLNPGSAIEDRQVGIEAMANWKAGYLTQLIVKNTCEM
jgi:hypothetical protein